MIIKSIELQNFRNYEDLNISFDEGTNIFMGIMRWKTNILEVAYLMEQLSPTNVVRTRK